MRVLRGEQMIIAALAAAERKHEKPYSRLAGWEMNPFRRMRASSPYGASSDTLKPRLTP